MSEPLQKISPHKLSKLKKKHREALTEFRVNAVLGWTKTNKRTFRMWSLLRHDFNNDGGIANEDELMARENSRRSDGTSAKEIIKSEARERARANKPAVVVIENRDGEDYRIGMVE